MKLCLALCVVVLCICVSSEARNLLSRSALGAKLRPYLVAASTALLLNCQTPPAPAHGADARDLVRTGMTQFRKGDIKGSLLSFDSAVKIAPSVSPYLWQRGISQYYNDDFTACSKQFRSDVAVNPADTEEVVWGAMCDARLSGFKTAQSSMLPLPQPDSRPVMRVVYNVFKGQSPKKLTITAQSLGGLGENGRPNPSAQFYANLYLGLYLEANNEPKASLESINTAAASSYCSDKGSGGDYMCSVAKNHKTLRTASAKAAAEAEAAAAAAAAEKAAAVAAAAAEQAAAAEKAEVAAEKAEQAAAVIRVRRK
jgi:hypothetical protein